MDKVPTLAAFDKLAADWKEYEKNNQTSTVELERFDMAVVMIRTGIELLFSLENSLATIAKCQQVLATPRENQKNRDI